MRFKLTIGGLTTECEFHEIALYLRDVRRAIEKGAKLTIERIEKESDS